MAQWNTKQIAKDLKLIPGVEKVKIYPPGGDVDTDNIIVKIKGADDSLFVSGFDDEDDPANPSDVDVPFIELTDGLSSDGGLNSTDKKVARVYIEIRQYFLNRAFYVVNTHKAYF